MILKGPLIGGLLLVLIMRWWARRSTPVRRGVLIVGWLVVAAQAVAATQQTWGHPPEPTNVILGGWLILAVLGAVVLWLQRDTRPETTARGRSARSGTGGGNQRTRRSGSAARSAGKALRNVLGEDRKR
jgi:peptidoglycan/LPS O-acetylase OafA/YrhL